MKLPDFILDYARNQCQIKGSDADIFKLVKMLFENNFDEKEIKTLIEYIDDFMEEGKYRGWE